MDLDKQLIKEVRNHPILYDPSQTGYKNVDEKQEVWKEIGRKLIGGEDDLTSVNALKVRWKSLRDAYVKERRYDMTKRYDTAMKQKRPWRLKTQMDFLAPFIQNRKDLTFDESKDGGDFMFSDEIKFQEETTQPALEELGLTQPNSDLKCQKTVLSQANSNTKHNRVLEIDSFFRGIADAVKSLTPKNQVLVQKEVTNLVMNYKLQELEEEDIRNHL